MSHPSSLTAAPFFALPDLEGTTRAIDEWLRDGAVLLVFHRGTW